MTESINHFKLAAAVARAAVDYEPFVVGEGLADHALVCFLQSLQIVEVDGDDRKFHDYVQIILFSKKIYLLCSRRYTYLAREDILT